MKRKPVSKFGSAKRFRGDLKSTRMANVMPVPRGGIRL